MRRLIYVQRLGVFVMKKWRCLVCDFVYDEAKGVPEEGIAPGTKWEDVPENWTCPDCGAGKSDFQMVEVD
jgi:rubredoxin